ncbi:MAG: hypothetical protein ABIQ18_37740 [Umezawaea sp.]
MATNTAPAFVWEDRQDRDSASNGHSRFEVYLGLNTKRFLDYDDTPTTDPVEFAVAALLVALPPIMSPGYVRTDSRVLDVVAHWDEEGRAAVVVSLVSALPGRVTTAARTAGWRREGIGSRRSWVQPDDNDRLTLLPTLTVRVPLSDVALPAPVYRDAVADVAVAKAAVAGLCGELNRVLAPVLAMLDAVGVGA